MKIALTGTIASGKSTVLKMLKDLGLNVIDIDKIVEMLYLDQELIDIIDLNFKAVIDNKIDKKILGEIIFNDPKKRLLLNSIVHPRIKDYIKKINYDCVIEMPLLFEANMQGLFDKVILVYVDYNTSLDRLIKRNNLSLDDAKKRINSQMSNDEKIKLSDYVIDNSTSLNETFESVKKIVGEIYGDVLNK